MVGLLCLGFLLGILLMVYFSGASSRVEHTLIDIYEVNMNININII